MGEFKRTRITWTETARIQLVEAVIKVEKEIFEDSKLVTGAGKLKTSATDREIWTRIANLLPLELRGKVWSNQSQGFVGYKCKHTFFHLVSAYRDQLAGKTSCYSRLMMTEPVCEIIKRRETLLSARTSTRAESSLKSGSSKRVKGDTSAAEHRQRGHQRQYAQEQTNRGVKSRKSIRWTEATRLLLIKAVMQVEEEETRNKDRKRSINSSGSRKPMGKWTRVANILDPVLRGRIWNNEQQGSSSFKYRYSFHDVVRAYRAMAGNQLQGGYHLRLTKPVYEAMKNREDLLRARNSRRVDLKSGKRSPGRFRMSTRSRKDHEQHLRSPTHSSSPNMQTDQDQSSQERSVDTAAQPAATFSLQHAHESEKMNTLSMSNHTESDGKDENHHGDMEGLLRRLIELEFSRLSSWVQSRSTRFKRVMQEMTSSAIESCMRCEINHNRSGAGTGEGRASGPFDNQRNLQRMIDYQILASFEKLRVQFTVDLKNASEELAQQVVQGFKASPGLNHSVGEGQSPFKKCRCR